MKKCFSRWDSIGCDYGGRRVLGCQTCGLWLRNDKAPGSCGLDTFYMQRTAVRLGSYNADIWRLKETLTELLGNYANAPAGSVRQSILGGKIKQKRDHIRDLMRRKRDQNDPINKWDAALRQGLTVPLPDVLKRR